jgi:hypothetical protein
MASNVGKCGLKQAANLLQHQQLVRNFAPLIPALSSCARFIPSTPRWTGSATNAGGEIAGRGKEVAPGPWAKRTEANLGETGSTPSRRAGQCHKPRSPETSCVSLTKPRDEGRLRARSFSSPEARNGRPVHQHARRAQWAPSSSRGEGSRLRRRSPARAPTPRTCCCAGSRWAAGGRRRRGRRSIRSVRPSAWCRCGRTNPSR